MRSPKYKFQGLINALTWSNGFCGERGKRGGMVGKGRVPWQRNVVIDFYDENLFEGLCIQIFPLDKAHKSQFFNIHVMS